MTATTLNNGVRKSLASQLDRLDSILDGLADNLNDAVAMAAASSVKEVLSVAVEKAVHAALVEVLSNAELQKRLVAAQIVNPEPVVPMSMRAVKAASSCWSWLTKIAKGTWTKMKAVTTRIVTAAGAKARQLSEQVVHNARKGWMLLSVLSTLAKRFRWQLAIATGIGVVVGVVCYLGGREVASAVCAFAGFVGSLASDAAAKVRRWLPFAVASDS
jgi:hypothetical protein